MFECELRETVVNIVPDGVGGDGAELVVGDFDREIELTAPADFDDGAVAVTCSAEEIGDERDGILRRGEADALWGDGEAGEHVAGREAVFAADEGVETLEREHEVGAALVVGHGVNFVHDDGADAREVCAGFFRSEQDEEGFGRGDEDVRRLLEHGAALGGERVAGAHSGADGWAEIAALKGELLYLLQRLFEVLADVVRERFERRDVDDFGVRLELACKRLTKKLVDTDKEGGERFAGAGGGGDERRARGEDRRPAFDLRLGCGAKAREKPLLDDGVSPCEGFGRGGIGSGRLHCDIVAPGFDVYSPRCACWESALRFC